MDNERLEKKINELPLSPGCYIFKNQAGEIIYIGKSKALKKRVRQYFQGVDKKEGKYKMLVKDIDDLDIIETESETDALILECQLIKRYLPRYNVQLKRDKHFAYIRITIREALPGISVTKEIFRDGSKYFGFFYSEEDARRTIDLINTIWQTPTCGRTAFQGSYRPCLNHHIGRCIGPCEPEIDKDEYKKVIAEVCKFLAGRSPGRIREIEREMKQAVRNLDFEKAAVCRDHLYTLGLLVRKSRRLNIPLKSHDVFLFFRGFHEPRCSLFCIRNGAVISRLDILDMKNPDIPGLEAYLERINQGSEAFPDGEFLTSCLIAIFADKYFIPAPGRWQKEKMAIKLKKYFQEYAGLNKTKEKVRKNESTLLL